MFFLIELHKNGQILTNKSTYIHKRKAYITITYNNCIIASLQYYTYFNGEYNSLFSTGHLFS